MKSNLLLSIAFLLFLFSCKKEDPKLGPPPTAWDASFTFAESVNNANILPLKRIIQLFNVFGILATEQVQKAQMFHAHTLMQEHTL